MLKTVAASTHIPVVMAIAGTDPTGGAGLPADIETIASMGCHCAPIVTCITVQDTHNVLSWVPLEAELVMQQARAVFEDMPVQAIKIGLLASVEIVQALHTLLHEYPMPVVLDPILAAGGGCPLADAALIEAIRVLLLPQTTVLTPNSVEARTLAPAADTLNACAMAILEQGTEWVLITGGHEPGLVVENVLYGAGRRVEGFSWERLPDQYHGSGCTLAAAIAGLLAQGQDPLTAIHEAQEYTWQSLKMGYRAGQGQRLPNRLFWARQ